MRRRLLTSVAARRRKRLLLAGADDAGPSYALSTFTAGAATGTADGSTAVTLTLTLRDTDNALMPAEAVTFVIGDGLVDAGESTLVDDAAEIAATTGTLNLILTVRNAAGVPLPNIAAGRIVFASTGSNNTFGTPSATDKNGQSLCTFSSTTAEAKTISVTVDGVAVTQTAAVTVTAGAPAQVALIFASQFRTTGTTNNDILDSTSTTPWTVRGGSGGEVIASTGLDFPTTNVLRITNTYCSPRKTGLGVPSVGTSRWYRFYIRVTQNDNSGGDGKTHPIQDGVNIGASNVAFYVRNYPSSGTAAGTWRMSFQSVGTAYPQDQFFLYTDLSRSATYRVEYQVNRLSTTTYNLHVRVYDSSGFLVYSDADFTAESGGGTLADDPTLTFNDVANMDGLNCGVNGVTGDEGTYGYQSGFAVSDEGWIGPYVANEAAA